MPKSIGTLLNELALKAGVKADNQALKDILANADLSKIVIPDDLVTEMEAGLHTLDSAKPKLKSILFKEAYDGLDAEGTRLMDELGLEDTVKQELLSEKSSTKRVVAFIKKIQELESKKAGAKSGDKVELQKEINDLKQKASDIAKQKDSELAALKEQHESDLVGYDLTSILSGYNYGLGDIPQEVKLDTARSTVQRDMQAAGVKVVRVNGTPKLVTIKDGTDYFDSANNKVDLKSFTDSSLGRNKLLKTTEPPKPGDNPPPVPGNDPTKPIDLGAIANVDEQLKSFQFSN